MLEKLVKKKTFKRTKITRKMIVDEILKLFFPKLLSKFFRII